MDVAALVISIVAVLIALGSVKYTRDQARATDRQADEAQRVAAIEAARRAADEADRQEAELAQKRANLSVRLQREPNTEGSIAEGPYNYVLAIANNGPAEARELKLQILSVWNDPRGTIPYLSGGLRFWGVGRLPAGDRAAAELVDHRGVNFDDIGRGASPWCVDCVGTGAPDRAFGASAAVPLRAL
jgi:hypothetical protein